jgi:diguanylate cyclase (GGDEF)-like protein
MGEKERDELEAAALLHDIGKIGVPDHVLLKPGRLSAEESMIINRHREFAKQILTGCCASDGLQDIIYYTFAWYNGRNREFDRLGQDLPLGSRMLAIADAFDAMTTDHVYRQAMSRERALGELFEHAGTQFDPNLVSQFSAFLSCDNRGLSQLVTRRWLKDLQQCDVQRFWRYSKPHVGSVFPLVGSLFHDQMLDAMYDGVVFVDAGFRILRWNRAVQVLSGITAASVEQQQWDPGLLQLRDEDYKLIGTDQCPVIQAIRDGTPARRRFFISDGDLDKVSMDATAIPVFGPDGSTYGATLILQDASSRVSLEERLNSLNEKAFQDGLTGVANREKLDRTHESWIETHLEKGSPYSLIICDLDHFKQVNDRYGHHAGDEALIAFASLLRGNCRSGDLVARYGGEEFVMLCSNCDIAAATARAESIREAWAATPHQVLGGKCLTASFGVTELQPGDSAETMLRRADRALLQAKEDGRNVVLQLGAGMAEGQHRQSWQRKWFSWWKTKPGAHLLQRRVITAVPLKLAAEKLRGFVLDHDADVLEVSPNRAVLEIAARHVPMTRRSGDRASPFLVEIQLEEIRLKLEGSTGGSDLRTVVHVEIRPKRHRDRRRRDADERARQLLASLKSYLMAEDFVKSRR